MANIPLNERRRKNGGDNYHNSASDLHRHGHDCKRNRKIIVFDQKIL